MRLGKLPEHSVTAVMAQMTGAGFMFWGELTADLFGILLIIGGGVFLVRACWQTKITAEQEAARAQQESSRRRQIVLASALSVALAVFALGKTWLHVRPFLGLQPGLAGTIISEDFFQSLRSGQTYVIVAIHIVNLGPPSVVTRYKLSRLRDGREEELSLVRDFGEEDWRVLNVDGSPGATYYLSDFLVEKTVTQPIQNGGAVVGWIAGRLTIARKEFFDLKYGPTLRVRFSDAKSQEYTIDEGGPNMVGMRNPGRTYVPGLRR
jgi:hypothetical protein